MQRLAYGALLLVLSTAAALLVADADVASRQTGLYVWTLAGAGLFAVAPPNVLLPDPNVPVVQLLNWSPLRLLRYQLGRLGPLVLLGAVPAVLIAFTDPVEPFRHLGAKSAALGQALLLLLGAALDSFVHFATIGQRSQAWHEGQAGQWYAATVEETGQGISLPRGLVPALYATTRCFVVAIVAVVVSAAGVQMGSVLLAWGSGLVLFGWAVARLVRRRSTYDRHFYHTTAFYAEVLGGGTLAAEGRASIPYEALYWVPTRWRPATWASLRQLDRRLPLGRLVAIAHLGLWLLALQGVEPALVSGYLVIVFTAQVSVCGLLGTTGAAPRPFQMALQSSVDWFFTRTFVNLRWLVPHAGSLALVALFSRVYGLSWVLAWTGGHLALSVAAAAVVTLATEGAARRSAA